MTPTHELRRRIEAQGFTGLSEEQILAVNPWMRLTPMLIGVLAALGAITRAPLVFVLLGAFAVAGAIRKRHPFDAFYDGVIRPVEHSPELPAGSPRRRFVFLMMAGIQGATAACFWRGHPILGQLLGFTFAGCMALLAATHICLPSEALDRILGPARKRSR